MATSDRTDNISRFLAIEVAGLPLAVPAPAVSAVHDSLDIFPVSATADWFLGMAVVQGRLLPVSDLGLWLGLRRCAGACLEIAGHLLQAGLQVDKVVAIIEQQSSPASEVASLSDHGEAIRQQLQRSLFRLSELGLVDNQIVSHNQQPYLCLDLDALLASPQFLDAEASR